MLEVMFSARENLKNYEDPADFTLDTKSWISPDWWARPQHYYSDADWQEIFEIWAREAPRGDEILYWEDVNIGDMPQVTLDGPIHSSVTPTAPFGMAVGGSRTMRELAIPEERAKMTRDPDTGLYIPKDMRQWDPEVPPYGGSIPQPTAAAKRGVFINYLGRDFAVRHINNWMGSHGWIENIRWGIMTNPVEQGLCFPPNPYAMDLISPVPALQGKKTTTHGLQYDVVKIHSQVYDKYEKNGAGFVDLGFWITTNWTFWQSCQEVLQGDSRFEPLSATLPEALWRISVFLYEMKRNDAITYRSAVLPNHVPGPVFLRRISASWRLAHPLRGRGLLFRNCIKLDGHSVFNAGYPDDIFENKRRITI